MLAQYGAVVVRGGHHQHDPWQTAISPLELTTSLQRLDIMETRFRVDADEIVTTQHDIPCPEIADTANRNLGAPVELVADLRPQPSQKSKLPRVANRRAMRIRSDRQAQTQRCTMLGKLIHAWRKPLRPLGSADTRLVEASGPGNLPLADAGRVSSVP